MSKTMKGPLDGVRVLDLSTMIAAPYGATLLGDLGADIIKIEMIGEGDTLRNVGPFFEGEPLRWPGLSRNKKSLTLDLHTKEGQHILTELAKETDILIENFRPGTLEKWGIGYEDLKKVNDNLIMVRVTGYGQTGPYKDKAGFGTPATAFSGFTYIQGYPDRAPISPSFSLTDYISGIFVAFSAVSAIYYRDVNEEGKGQYIDMGLYESVFRMFEFMIAEYDKMGVIRERSPNLSGHSSPGGTFQTKDDHWVVLVTSTDRTFNRLATAMGREEMIQDDRFYTNEVRLKHNDLMNQIVRDWIKTIDRKDLLELLDKEGVPVSPINSIKDIFEDEHYKERENIVEIDHPRLGKIKVPGVVPKFSETPGSIRNIAPDLGENNEDILKGLLNYTDEQIQELREKKVI